MSNRRWLSLTVFAALLVLVVPQLVSASVGGDHSAVSRAAFLTGCTSDTVSAQPNTEITQVASVLQHTERERAFRVHRDEANARQEARASGYTLDRVLEIALHPMFLLLLAVPLLRKARAS